MHTQVCCRSDATTQPEEGVEAIEDGRDEWIFERVEENGSNQVQHRQHAKHGHEHVVVDYAWVALNSCRNHASNEGHDDKRTKGLDCHRS